MIMSLLLLATGGTFDKEYNELDGELSFSNTHLSDILRLSKNTIPLRLETIFLMDSLEMTDAHRRKLVRYCECTPEDRIVITHGTDTMSITAEYMSSRIKNKTIVLTGAMVPYAFGSSDGLFNLGTAFAFVQTLPPGVYVAMNGEYFNAGRVRKNKEKGVFERVEG
jgi:L-asparaginase